MCPVCWNDESSRGFTAKVQHVFFWGSGNDTIRDKPQNATSTTAEDKHTRLIEKVIMVAKKAEKPIVKERKKHVLGEKKELKAILKTLKEIRDIMENIWRERLP